MAERIYDIKEIAKRTKESLAEKFPNLIFKVTFDRRGGSTMNVRLMKGDFNPFTDPTNVKSLPINWRWIKNDDNLTDEAKKVLSEVVTISQKYNWDNSDPITDYFDVNYYLNMSIGLPDEKPYEYNPPKSKRTKSGTSSSGSSGGGYSAGEVLMSCSGWTIYKKTLDDGRIVYNARINKDTTPNKSDWNLIKGEIYTETGFKWGKFGSFDKWGQIASEAFVLKKLCDILGKYYTAGATSVPIPAPAPTTLPFSVGDEFSIGNYPDVYVITDIKNGEVYYMNTVTNLTMRLDIPDVVGFFEKGVWKKIEYEEPQPPLPTTPTTKEKNRLFMVGDKFYNVNYPDLKYFISSINSNDEVGFASIITPKAESIYGSVEEVNKLFREGTWIKDGRYDYPEETSKAKSKEDIQKAIKGLQYLADRGNENAKKAIKGLQYLLNK